MQLPKGSPIGIGRKTETDTDGGSNDFACQTEIDLADSFQAAVKSW